MPYIDDHVLYCTNRRCAIPALRGVGDGGDRVDVSPPTEMLGDALYIIPPENVGIKIIKLINWHKNNLKNAFF